MWCSEVENRRQMESLAEGGKMFPGLILLFGGNTARLEEFTKMRLGVD